MVSGAFLGRAYFDYFLTVVASTVVLEQVFLDEWSTVSRDITMEERERVTTSIILLGVALFVACRQWAPGSMRLSLLSKGAVLAIFPLLLWKLRIVSADEALTVVSIKEWILAAMGRGPRKTGTHGARFHRPSIVL